MIDENPWLTITRPRPQAAMRLFCFAGAGAGGASYRPWPALLGDSVEVCAVELPGHWQRDTEPLMTDIQALCAAAGQSGLPVHDKPFAFFGFSMGALVAFELARWLRRNNTPLPSRLFVAGRFPPNTSAPTSELLHLLPDSEFIERMSRVYGVPASFRMEEDLVRLIAPIMRADMQVLETYRFDKELPLSCPITAMAGDNDPSVPLAKLEAWQDLTTEPLTVRLFPGQHHFIEAQMAAVVGAVREDLGR